MKFSKDLWDGFGTVAGHADRGVTLAKEISTFMVKLAKAEKDYADALNKLLAQTRKNRAKRIDAKDYTSMYRFWDGLLDQITYLSAKRTGLADRITANSKAFDEFVADKEAARKKLIQEGKAAEKALNQARDALFKAQSAFHKSYSDREAAIEKYDKAVVDKKTQNETGKLYNTAEKAKKTYEDKKAAYTKALDAANKAQSHYYDTVMPVVLDSLQGTVQNLTDQLRSHCQHLIKSYGPSKNIQRDVVDGISKLVDAINPATDMKMFVHHNAMGGAPPPPIEYWDPQEGEKTMFGITLKEVMDQQARDGDRGPLPKIVPALTDMIRQLGGLEVEGIFRISANAGEVRHLRREIERGNIDQHKVVDPHVPAHLLKQWMRDLADPVVPEKLYLEAMKAAAAAQADDTSKPIADFMKRLPAVNRAVIVHIAEFVAGIDEAKTLMSLDNLAIVFGPCFARAPSSGGDQLLTYSGMEPSFARRVFDLYSGAAPSGGGGARRKKSARAGPSASRGRNKSGSTINRSKFTSQVHQRSDSIGSAS